MPVQLSGSLELTGSIVLSGSITTTGVVAMNGPITASAILSTGNITAQTLVVSTISSSVAYSSGSNIFGNNSTNRQTFTGSLYITGSVGIDAASSFRFNGVADISHAVGYDSTVDGAFLRGQNGVRLITGTGGGNERMRITSTGEACFACMVCAPYINSSGGGIINTTSNVLTFYNSAGGGNAKRFGLCMTNADTFKIYSQCDNGTVRKDNIIIANIDGAVGIGTATTSAEGNLFLGAQGTTEGGQLTLQKGTACSCATHLDNYQDSFRVLVGTDVGSNGVHFLVDHKTRNACLYGTLQVPIVYNCASRWQLAGSIEGGNNACALVINVDGTRAVRVRGIVGAISGQTMTSMGMYEAILYRIGSTGGNESKRFAVLVDCNASPGNSQGIQMNVVNDNLYIQNKTGMSYAQTINVWAEPFFG